MDIFFVTCIRLSREWVLPLLAEGPQEEKPLMSTA